MKSVSKSTRLAPSGPHKKATYTLPPDALDAVDENWRFHETLNARLSDSKSEYVADLILRDALRKGDESRLRTITTAAAAKYDGSSSKKKRARA